MLAHAALAIIAIAFVSFAVCGGLTLRRMSAVLSPAGTGSGRGLEAATIVSLATFFVAGAVFLIQGIV